MPWENADPFGTAAGAFASYLDGKQSAKDREYRQQQDAIATQQGADANATAAAYKNAEIAIQQQNADTKSTAESDANAARTLLREQQEKDKLREDGTKRYAIQQTAIYHSTMAQDAKWRTLAQIEARHQDIQAQIASGQLKTDKEVAARYAAIDASIAKSIRDNDTSRSNNAATNATRVSTNAASNATSRANNANSVSGAAARAAATRAMTEYTTKLKANTAAVAAGNDPPYPDLKPPADGGTGAAPPNPAVAAFVKIAGTVPKAQREKLVTTSKPYLSADAATKQAILAAVQALP